MLGWRLGESGSSLVVATDGVRLCTRSGAIASCESVVEGTLDALLDALDALLDALDLLLDALLCGDTAPGTATASSTPYAEEEAADETRDALLDGLWCPGASGTTSDALDRDLLDARDDALLDGLCCIGGVRS